MRFYTISEAAERLNINKKTIEWWFYNKFNPLELVSGIKIIKVNGRRIISEEIIEAYENFIKNYMTYKEIAESLGLQHEVVRTWIRCRKNQIKVRKIGGTVYIHKDVIEQLRKETSLDTSNCMSTTEISEYLQVHRSTALDAIHKGHIPGGFAARGIYYAPTESVEWYKNKYLKIEDSSEYYSIGKAATILGCTSRTLRTMVRSPKVEISAIKNNLKNTYYLLKNDVYTFKNFLDDIPHKYYTAKQIVEKYNVSYAYVQKLLSEHLVDKIKWVLLIKQLERVILIADFEEFYASYDKYRTEKTIDPQTIFHNAVASITSPTHLSTTKAFYLDFVSLKQNTSRASMECQRMFAREFAFLYQTLMSLDKELFLFSDNEVKWFLRITTNTNQRKNLVSFLLYLQERVQTEYREKYRVASKQRVARHKDIYSLDEFVAIEKYLSNIEFHLLEALKDRRYAVTWFYTSLHLTNAWRSSDFLRLPSTDISLINVNDFQWFYDGIRLTVEQSQRIVSTLAHTRLIVSKTGALNRFLVNQDMLVPIATMIVVCELHRKKENDQFPLTTGNNNYTLIKNKLSSFFPSHIKFSSMKMNRSFMTHLFYKASESSNSMGVALDLAQQTRRHRKKDSTAIYIQSTDKDGPIGNATLNLCNRGHFGYLYNLLIERTFSLTNRVREDTLNERTLKILEYKAVFPTPYSLERFGDFLKAQAQERESLAVRVALMSPNETGSLLRLVYMDKLPGHTEHIQCFIFPECIYPSATSCIGCPNAIPKNYLLQSIGIELNKRIAILNDTSNPFVASREKSWIHKLLLLLQEATDTFGIEYTRTFLDYDDLLARVASAYNNQHSLQINLRRSDNE